jgi:hypothetical protein
MSDSNVNFVLLSDTDTAQEISEEPIPLETEVDLVETLEPVLTEEVEDEVKKTSIFTKQFSFILAGLALGGLVLPIVLGIQDRSQISNGFENQVTEIKNTTAYSVEALKNKIQSLNSQH